MGNRGARDSLMIRYGRRCMLCHKKLRRGKVTYHHIIPQSEGGETTMENGAILCFDCHKNLHRQNEEGQRLLNKKIRKFKKFIDEL